MTSWLTPTPGVVYRHYDRDGVLLYIGSSDIYKFPSRQDDHAKAARWWRYVARIEHEVVPPGRRAAYLAEFAAMKTERPIFNRTSRTLAAWQQARESDYLRRQLAVLALVSPEGARQCL